jgi:hypothetical protein
MKAVYAIELNENLLEDELESFQNECVQIFVDDSILIMQSVLDAKKIKDYLIKIGKYEDFYQLIQIEQPEITDLFDDYGFNLGRSYFLITELVCCFTIIKGEKEQIEMALIQMEECLLGLEQEDNQQFYFVDIQQKELIERFATAYEIEVSFFDLDKWTEND